jgi:NADH-quinone oxidoreductase subunit H
MHLAMDISFIVGSALVAALFLGGPMAPWAITPVWLGWIAGFILFLVKTLAVLVVLASFRVATGRIRLDQLNRIGWKYIAGAAIVQVALVLVMNRYMAGVPWV